MQHVSDLQIAGLPGAAHLALADGVVHLDPASAVFEAMLEGWATQQRARFLKANTIGPRLELVRRFAAFTNQYPWQWKPAEAEAFITHSPVAVSTARNYQNTLRLFCGYASDARYGWAAKCLEQFGSAPRQILDEWNTVAHVTEYEGQPHRRPLTYDEVQALFDAADGRVEEIRSRGRKGALAAQRDAALLKTVYAFGLRRREAWGLDLADLRHNPQARQFAGYGGRVRAVGQVIQRQPAEAPDGPHGAGDGLGGNFAAAVGRGGPPAVHPWRPSGVVGHRTTWANVPAGDQRGIRGGP
jgi:integrase/recombinase XerD